MLVSEIVKRVRDAAGDTNVLQFSQPTITDWINDGIRECVLENSLLQARGSSSTVVGQGEYTLPPDIFKLHSVYYNKAKLEILTLEQWEARYNTEDVPPNGTPLVCYVYANSLTVWPSPDSIHDLQINYTKLPVSITYTSGPPEVWNPQSPAINEAFHSRLVAYCLAQVALQDEDNFKYNMLMTEFKTGVRDLQHMKDEDSLYPSITVSPRDSGGMDGYEW